MVCTIISVSRSQVQSAMTVTDQLDVHPEKQVQSDQVQALQQGDRIALYAASQFTEKVLIGTVSNRLIDDLTDDSDARGGTFIGIDYSTMYEVADGELADVTDELNDRPPYRHHLDQPFKDPASPCLMYDEADAFTLVIPQPTWCHGRVDGYYPTEVGVVLDVVFGETIWPGDVIPDDIEHGDCID